MAFAVKDTLDVIRSELMTTNHFSAVEIGEPKSPPADAKITVHLWMSSISVVALTLSKTIEVYVITVRVMSGMFQEPEALIETQMAEVVSRVSEELFANFSLDNKIRHIDIGGIYGVNYRADWGHADISGKLFRVADITLPLVVDDSASHTP